MLLNRLEKKHVMSIVFAAIIPLNAAMAAEDGKRRGPPAEAFAACASVTEGTACSVTTDRGTLEGTCKAPPRDQEGELACAPERGSRDGGNRPSRRESSN